MQYDEGLSARGRRVRGFFEFLAEVRILTKNTRLIEVAKKLALDMELGRV